MRIPLIVCLWVSLAGIPWANLANAAEAETDKNVDFHVSIKDKASGFSLVMAKRIAKNTNAFDALRSSVQEKHQDYTGLGPFVTSLCGIDAPSGSYWQLTVDGKVSNKGIAAITIDKNIDMIWEVKEK